MTTDSKVTIHMVSSVDGYIVKNDGSVAWLETSDNYEAGVDGEDPEEFLGDGVPFFDRVGVEGPLHLGRQGLQERHGRALVRST